MKMKTMEMDYGFKNWVSHMEKDLNFQIKCLLYVSSGQKTKLKKCNIFFMIQCFCVIFLVFFISESTNMINSRPSIHD